MKRIFAFVAALLVGVAAFAQEDPDMVYGKDLLAAGTVAPDFTLKDIDGRSVSLSDFRGKQVVLHFWASWCPDCREETPQLKAAQAAADPSKVVFVSVSFDKWRPSRPMCAKMPWAVCSCSMPPVRRSPLWARPTM